MKGFNSGLGMLALASGGTVLLVAGCATDNSRALSASLTSDQYAQLSVEQCTGIPTKEQELGVMAYRDAVANAQPLKESYAVGKVNFTHDRGVQIALRSQPNLSAPWLARVANCHIALARSGRITAMEGDPLLVAGATVDVAEAYTGYVVTVRVPDDTGAAEVMRRTTVALTAPSGPATAERIAH